MIMIKWIACGWILAASVLAQPLKVVCWNIHHGRGSDERIDLDRIAAVIAAETPDIVALQEIDQATRRSGGVDQAAVLGEKLGMEVVFGKAMDFQGGGYGLAVLSRLPLDGHRIHRLPGAGEPRIALEAVVRSGAEELSVVCVHLDHQAEAVRVAQVEALQKALDGRKRVLLCGDFNDVPGSAALQGFSGEWQLVSKEHPAATYPAPQPERDIDHFLLRGLEPVGRLRVVGEKLASDHRPVAGTIDTSPAGPEAEIALKAPQARAILDAWHATDPQPGKRRLHIVLWTPADREPAPRHRERLSAIMRHIQAYYAGEMERLGFGPRTIQLDEQEDGLLRIHLVRGKAPYADYDVRSGARIRSESAPTLRAAGIDPDRETLVIFCNMSNWDREAHTISQNSPYYASGSHRSGNAWQVDSPILDLDLIAKNEPKVRDGQYREISIGRYNSIFIGGVAHELGHALGLPHNLERADERAAFGTALMGGGNMTYGQELRGEGKGSFITLAHGLRLASHPMFSGSVKGMDLPPNARPQNLRIEADGKGIRVSGTVRAEPPVYAVIAYLDPEGRSDYDATTATAVPDAQGNFILECRDLVPGRNGELRLTFLQAHGAASGPMSATPYRYPYQIDAVGRVDLGSTPDRLALAPLAALLHRNPPDLDAARAWAAGEYPGKNSHTQAVAARLIASFSAHAPLDDLPAKLPLSDLPPDQARVGWGRPLRDRVPEPPFLLVSGDGLFAHGLYAHAPAQSEWRLDGVWKSLSGHAGLAAGRDGSVRFRIEGDGKVLWQSPVVRQRDAPLPFDVPLEGVKRLALITDDGGDGNASDWALWLEPMLSR
jgi:endonuclease/exonuclease/phosphatase family metal-dependent hydrolase